MTQTNTENIEVFPSESPTLTNHDCSSKDNASIKNRHQWKSYVTPDFQSMNNIVFWNSFGFFFFGFILRFAIDQIWDISGFNMGLVFSSMNLGGLISTPIVGILTDKISKKKLVLIGSFGRALSYLIMYFGICGQSVFLFTTGVMILGFAVGFFWTPLNALISQKTFKTVRSTAFGQQAGAIGLGNLIGSFLTILYFGGMLLLSYDNPWVLYLPLFIFCIFNILAGLIFHARVDEHFTFKDFVSQQNTDLARNLYQEVIRDEKAQHIDSSSSSIDTDSASSKRNVLPKTLLLGISFLMAAFFTASINQSLAGPFLQAFLTNEFFSGQDALKIAFLVMLVYFPSEVLAQLFAPFLGKLADRIPIVPALSVISGTGALITYLLINSKNPIIFGLILLLDVTFAWANGLVLQNLMSRISQSNRGKIFGMQRWVSLFGAVIGPILGGLVWDSFGRFAPFYISIVVELSLIPLYIFSIRLIQPHMAEKLEQDVK